MKYPLQKQAQELQSHGRYGDTVLVHLNPVELQGIAALSPTGKLTTNPVTGQPEAFLPMLAAMGGSWLGNAALGATLGSTLASAIGSGIMTTALTGDIKRGLASGLIGAGVGSAIGGVSGGAEGAVPEAAVGVEGVGDITSAEEILRAGVDTGAPILEPGSVASQSGMTPPPGFAKDFHLPPTYQQEAMGRLQDPVGGNWRGFGEGLMEPKSILPIALGGGNLAQMDVEDDFRDDAKDLEREENDKLAEAYNNLQMGYRRAQPGAPTGTSDLRSRMSYYTQPPARYEAGGLTRANLEMVRSGSTSWPSAVPTEQAPALKYPTIDGGVASLLENPASGINNSFPSYGQAGLNFLANRSPYGTGTGIDPVSVQAGLRGSHVVTPPSTYRPGFDPEFDYFRTNPSEGRAPADPYAKYNAMSPEKKDKFNAGLVRKWEANPLSFFTPHNPNPPPRPEPVPEPDPYHRYNSLDKKGKEKFHQGLARIWAQNPSALFKNFAEGGEVQVQTPLGNQAIAGGGIAGVPTDMLAAPQQQPEPQDIQMLAQALLQAPEGAEQVIEMFVQKYGPEVFAQVRDMILQSVVPDAQTEGMISGPGGGMDDQVPGMIGEQQPVAVSSGEYIVPADVVSGLGDGSSEAGAAELDRMLGNVRQARTGGKMQAPDVNAASLVPR
jgi:hypothetical protein